MNLDYPKKIAGRYTHYKGREYEVYCFAIDRNNNEYILYQQCYGDKSFWIRPYSMFFDTVVFEEKEVKRFTAKTRSLQTGNKTMKKLIKLIEQQNIKIKHSETNNPVIITNINAEWNYVIVHQIECGLSSGYLTEYELVKRMGYNSCRINDEIKYFKNELHNKTSYSLCIGENNIDILKKYLNPCSIDLQIADSGFLRTRFKLVDPQSVEHISSASELWKPVKKHTSKNGGAAYFRVTPSSTILTHTKERIHIPKDCAGKIEIKSTFARLSLSITFGDFCNPGYDGHFPLEIKNNGRHTIIIHENETMAQLILIPLQGPILDEYSYKATFKNIKGYDDGTPYSFWNERSLKLLRHKHGTQQIIELSQNILNSINAQNTGDINGFRDRFNNNFLPFCHKNINKIKYKNKDTSQPDAKKLMNAYITREKRLKKVFGLKYPSFFASLLNTVLPFFFQGNSNNNNLASNSVTTFPLWPCFLLAGLFLLLSLFMFIFTPKTFCTFENIDIDKQIENTTSV